jgi:TetR/AcrR family transcriptional regulator
MDTHSHDTHAPLDTAEVDPHVRVRLLRAAVDVFDRKGYAAASVREIVERAGVSKPALYYHFGSKEGVLLAILAEATREFGAAVERGVRAPGTARARLATMCDEVYALLRRNVPVVRVAHAMSFGPIEGAPAFNPTEPDRVLRVAVEQILQDGVAAGELRAVPVFDLVRALMGIIGECIHHEIHNPSDPIGPERLRQVLNLVFEGLMAARPLASPAGEAHPQENRLR